MIQIKHKITAYLLHGFNVSDAGAGSIDRIKPYFLATGYNAIELDSGWTGLVGVRLCNRKQARMLSALATRGSVAVGHSNGCALIHLAARFGAPFDQVVYINPALNKDAALAPQVRRAHVWHSPSDTPVRLARWLPWHVWGEMGAKGYTGSDRRYRNYDKENQYERSSATHSDVFEPDNLAYFAPIILKALADG